MEAKEYSKVLLFMGVMTSIGVPEALKERLEAEFGALSFITEPFPFTYTTYYDEEMGRPIERLFISFESLINPDELGKIKEKTNSIERIFMVDGKRKVNLDPGIITDSSVILATTKNRSHRIAIGNNLYAELTLIYQKGEWNSFSWTYSDYRDKKVQGIMSSFRRDLLIKKRNFGKI